MKEERDQLSLASKGFILAFLGVKIMGKKLGNFRKVVFFLSGAMTFSLLVWLFG